MHVCFYNNHIGSAACTDLALNINAAEEFRFLNSCTKWTVSETTLFHYVSVCDGCLNNCSNVSSSIYTHSDSGLSFFPVLFRVPFHKQNRKDANNIERQEGGSLDKIDEILNPHWLFGS